MKIKNFALFLICISLVTVVIFLLGDSPPSINQLVTQTQGRITEWTNAKVDENIEPVPDPAEKYLLKLGFYKPSRFYPDQEWRSVPLPVFVTAVSSSDVYLAPGFVHSFLYCLPDYMLLIYDLDTNPEEIFKLKTICNSSNCAIRKFDFDSYPSHVRDLKLSAFRPIIIQEVLNQIGAVLWLDVQFVFTSSDIKKVLTQAEKVGIVSWSINHPTSALTHPRMFDYFHTSQENYFFHRMVQPNHIVLYNTASIHQKLMQPWVRCSLILNCIAPIGAQSSGCRFDKKPLFRYSGCHRYDMSALNVALGIMFDFTATTYVAKDEDAFFQHIESESRKTTLERDYVKNTSSTVLDIASNIK